MNFFCNFCYNVDAIFVTGGAGHNQTELLSLSTWSWQKRAPCPLSRLDQKPSLFLNQSFYLFGQQTKGDNKIASAVARFDPLQNEWHVLDGYGAPRERFAVVNTQHGVIVVDGESSNKMTNLCQINYTDVTCSNMVIKDPELIVWDGEIILFTFDHATCPESVKRAEAMLLLSTFTSRNEL